MTDRSKDRHKDPDAHRAKVRAQYHRDPEKRLRYERKLKYGISEETFQNMLITQAGRCAICDEPMRVPAVDHDHETGRVRGLLHPKCNTAIGLLNDDPRRLQRAIGYLNAQ